MKEIHLTECKYLTSSILLMAEHLENLAGKLDKDSVRQMLEDIMSAKKIL
ncbi:MAG: hypothetical protein R2741_10895 [Methanolobus sp.]